MGKIYIAMATYNGARYIKSQIESIQRQTVEDWVLIIQDDGSKDDTLKIVEEMRGEDPRIEVIINETQNHGAFANFYTLIKKIKDGVFGNDYSYIALSDQDDIWHENKLEEQIQLIKTIDTQPALVYGNYRIIDENNTVVMNNANDQIGMVPSSPYALFFANAYVWGNTVVFNKKLMEELDISDESITSGYPHDAYLAKVATLIGVIKFNEETLIDYRRFSDNVSSTMWYRLSLLDFLKKLNPSVRSKTLGVTLDQDLLILDKYKTNKGEELKNIIRTGGLKGIFYLRKNRIYRKQVLRNLSLYIVFLSGIYKKWIR
ncbi:glycosyltransferase [Latilactobacillus curvatus]|uniref:glycosyltransferase n=1 Tax=Latilactobacillus curvatus TaxID=28038 RepID=UPI00240F8CFC|nr:glycosyltransferase [Latilactobacillus curvatus]MDG2982023.1 glycosyltransferase [Latilactobacillus curvatus]